MSVSATGDCGDEDEDEPLRVSVSGAINIFYIVGIVTAVAFVNESHIPAMGGEDAPLYMKLLREIILVGITSRGSRLRRSPFCSSESSLR